MLILILDTDNRTPISTDQDGYVAWLMSGGARHRRVAITGSLQQAWMDPVGYEISTVFLDGPQIDDKGFCFETQVYADSDPEYDNYQERYKTYEDALAGHLRIVEVLMQRVSR